MWQWIICNSDGLNFCIQTLVFIALVFYAWDTNSIKRQGSRQISILERQLKLAIAPFLVFGIRENESQTDPKTSKLYINVSNPTSKIALDVFGFIYDSGNKNFLNSESTKVYIGEKEEKSTISLYAKVFSKDEIKENLSSHYGAEIERFFPNIKEEKLSLIFLFYRDAEGNLYGYKRGYEVEEGGKKKSYYKISSLQ